MYRAFFVAFLLIGAREAAAASADPLRDELARMSKLSATETSSDAMWLDLKNAAAAPLAAAEQAMKDGRRLLALQKLSLARLNLSAAEFLIGHSSAQRKQDAAFEAEWTKNGPAIRADQGNFEAVEPLAVRAIAELARAQAPVFYEAALEYSRNTNPDAGLYYLGAARAQLETVALCRALSTPSPIKNPPLRSIAGELRDLRAELLALYRPPASIDRHSEMILVSALLNEAIELDTAGVRAAALLRYLQAAQRIVPLRKTNKKTVARRIDEVEARLTDPKASRDHSLGLLFLETARAETPEVAAAIVAEVFPRYFAALEPLKSNPPKTSQPQTTVTLVRWPFT